MPNYDDATASNAAVAARLRKETDQLLLGSSATTEHLGCLLRGGRDHLFAMCHGGADGLLVQNGQPCTTLSARAIEGAPIQARAVFAHACYSAIGLGPALSRIGCTFIGYDKPVNAPESEAEMLDIFCDVFSFIKNAFIHIQTADDVVGFFRNLSSVCEAAREQLEEQCGGWAPFAAYQCLIQIEKDLRVWRPGATGPETAGKEDSLARI